MKMIARRGRFLFFFASPVRAYDENDLWPASEMTRLPPAYLALAARRWTRLASLVIINVVLGIFDVAFALLPLPLFTSYGTFLRWLGFRIGKAKEGYRVEDDGTVYLITKREVYYGGRCAAFAKDDAETKH